MSGFEVDPHHPWTEVENVDGQWGVIRGNDLETFIEMGSVQSATAEAERRNDSTKACRPILKEDGTLVCSVCGDVMYRTPEENWVPPSDRSRA